MLWASGKDWLFDFKTGSVNKSQLKDFLRYAHQNNLRVGYLFDKPATAEQLAAIRAAEQEVAAELGLSAPLTVECRHLNIVLQAKPIPLPELPAGQELVTPTPGVLTAGEQNPVDGSLDDTINRSEDSAEMAERLAEVRGQLNEDWKTQLQQPPGPAAAPPQPSQEPAPGQVPPEITAGDTAGRATATALTDAANGVPNVIPTVTGGVTDAAAPDAVGGVDFSTLELRYVADTSYNGAGLRYAFAANTTSSTAPSFGGRANAYQASDAFFVWLALRPEAFTVNLNPNEPERIMDAQFGRTDAGRILLQADFDMKKLDAQFADPATPDGRRYQDTLQGEKKCSSPQRKWIVPKPASVHTEGDALYILDAPLDVKLEILGDDLKPGIGCAGQDQAITQGNDQLYQDTILPQIVDAVNHAPEYAELRRVYTSRIAAEWYRQRSAANPATAYADIINSGDITAWTSKQAWSPQEIYDQYRKAFYEGIATFTWQDGDTTWTMTVGGVDFTEVPMVEVDAAEFTRAHPTLAASAAASLFSPQSEDSGKQVWLGGLTSARPLSEVWKPDPALFVSLPDALGDALPPIGYAVITLPLAAWLGTGGYLWWRRRRVSAGWGGR